MTYSSLEGSGEDEGGETTSRWHFGWWNEEPSDVQQRREETSSGPRFDRTLARKVTVQEGSTAVLACRVVDNSEKAVRMLYIFWRGVGDDGFACINYVVGGVLAVVFVVVVVVFAPPSPPHPMGVCFY